MMIRRIQDWVAYRNDLLKLEAMSDRLLADMGVERADLRVWLAGQKPATTRRGRPLALRVRNAVSAFVRELRTAEPSPSH